MKRIKLSTVVATLTTIITVVSLNGGANAAFIPVGVQQNVAVSTVTGAWGWTVAWSGTYGQSGIDLATTVFGSVPAGSYVMYAARPVGAENYTLLAAALESDARTYTALDVTTTANGAEWYYNGYSMGFAGLGDIITQFSADTQDSSLDGYAGLNGDLRLSWHTSGPNSYFGAPDTMHGGWRAGYNDWLNSSSDWERAVLFAPVPEPSTYLAGAMLLLPFGVQGIRRLRNRKQVS